MVRETDPTPSLIGLRSFAFFNQIISQIALPTIFIIQSNLSNYGFWLAINSYSGFLAFLDLGFFAVIPTAVMANSSANLSKRDKERLHAMRNYSTGISSFGLVSLLLLYFSGHILDIQFIRSEFFELCLLSSANVLIILKLRYYEASYRSINSTFGFKILTIHSTITMLFNISVLFFRGSITEMLILNLLISILFFVFYRLKGDSFDNEKISFTDTFLILRNFFRLGCAYQLFPIGYLMINQGINIVIQHLGGYEVLGQLGAIRTFVGVFRQLSSVFINSSIPYISLLIKNNSQNEANLRFQNIKNLVYALNLIIFLFLFLSLSVYFFYGNSTFKSIPIVTCILFLISALLDVPWNVWLLLSLSVNKHDNLAVRFLVSSVLSFLLTAPAYSYMGISGVAIALLVQDLIMTAKTVRQGKRILDSGLNLE